MKIYIGADHAGFELKEKIVKWLKSKKIEYSDCGALKLVKGDDYPIYAFSVAEKVVSEKERGILICGSGAGVCVAANKVLGARAALIHDIKMAKSAQADDNINILCLGAKFISFANAIKVIDAWLKTEFKKEEKYIERLNQIVDYELK